MDIKKIESLQFITDFKKKLRKKQYANSTIIAMETAKLFRDLIKELSKDVISKQGSSFNDLLSVLRALGKSFIAVDPLQFSVGNIIKRILHIVREEYNKISTLDDKIEKENDTKKIRLMRMTSLNNLIDYNNLKLSQTPKLNSKTSVKSITDEDAEESNDYTTTQPNEEMKEHMQTIIMNIDELMDELESISDLIKDQSYEHINDNDIILTANHSDQLEEFFIEAAKVKSFHVIIAESSPSLK